MPQNLALIIFELVIMVLSICLHDLAQAWMANRLGDPTARMMGRITMNPAQHFDLFGMVVSPALSIFIFHNLLPYGWSKPVPMTFRNFRKKNGEMLSVAAGPAAQFLAAIFALVLLVMLKHGAPGASLWLTVVVQLAQYHMVPLDGLTGAPTIFPVMLLLYMCIVMNLFLCVFNLLPMPFLDGGKLLVHFLPYNAAKAFEQYSFYFLIAFFFIGGFVISIVLSPLLSVFQALLFSL
jgi:Zn-dependent protease